MWATFSNSNEVGIVCVKQVVICCNVKTGDDLLCAVSSSCGFQRNIQKSHVDESGNN